MNLSSDRALRPSTTDAITSGNAVGAPGARLEGGEQSAPVPAQDKGKGKGELACYLSFNSFSC